MKTDATRLNLPALDGVRCVSCLSVVLFHTHLLIGSKILPTTTSCVQFLNGFPVLGKVLFVPSFQMSIFWLISGLLFEYQLSSLPTKLGKALKVRDYTKFLLNRICRLFPLLFLVATLIYLARPECNFNMYLKAITFTETDPNLNTKCTIVGWSLMNNVHGYLIIIVTFASVPRKPRQLFYLLLSVAAIARMLSFLKDWDTNTIEYAWDHGLGLDTSISPSKKFLRFFPEVNVEEPQLLQVRHFLHAFRKQVYHTTVFQHGHCVTLGSLLCMRLQDRAGRAEHSWIKLLGACLILYLTQYTLIFFGLPLYLLMDVLLTTPLTARVNVLFTNRLWSCLAPYTYGIYMTHVFLIFLWRAPAVHKQWVTAMESGQTDVPCRQYTSYLLVREFVVVTAVATCLAYASIRTAERPFTKFWRRYLGPTNPTSLP